MEDREKKEAALAIEDPNHDRYGQDRFLKLIEMHPGIHPICGVSSK